jgi:hypothetical protein
VKRHARSNARMGGISHSIVSLCNFLFVEKHVRENFTTLEERKQLKNNRTERRKNKGT